MHPAGGFGCARVGTTYWIGPVGRVENAFSPAIAIPSITGRAISSQKLPSGMSAYFLRV
jgi:hypothetical protein